MSRREDRLADAQRNVASAAARVDELAALMPEPVASVSAALASLTPEQREAIWANRDEAIAALASQAAESRADLERLTVNSRMLHAELLALFHSQFAAHEAANHEHGDEHGDEHRGVRDGASSVRDSPRSAQIAATPADDDAMNAWMDTFQRAGDISVQSEGLDEYVGQLKMLVVELDALRAELEANPVAPTYDSTTRPPGPAASP